MKLPWYQQFIIAIGLLLGGFLAVGGILDTIGNVQDLISMKNAVLITLVTLFFWGLIEYAVYKTPQEWVTKNNRRVWIVGLGKGVRYPIIGALIAIWGSLMLKEEITPNETQLSQESYSVFSANDSMAFNVLIVRFEDYIVREDTYCIGRAIQENLNTLQPEEPLSLSLNVQYVDTIMSPASLREAQEIQKKHNADLIIYGLAKNVLEGCGGADICFRYNIDKAVTAQIAPAIKTRTTKHDREYIRTSPIELEEGLLQVDALSLERWINSLINIKANKTDEAFLELDILGNDSTATLINRVRRYYAIGKTYHDLKQYERAIDALNKVIALNPNYIVAHSRKGGIYFELKAYKRALKSYNKAIKLNPKNTNYYATRAGAFYRLKNYKNALKDCNKAIELDSNLASTYSIRGNVFKKLNDYRKSLEDYNKAIELNPNITGPYINRAILNLKLKSYDKALKDCDKAISLNPKFEPAYSNRANVLRMLKKNKRAIEDCNKAIELNPDSEYSYLNRGSAYTGLKNNEKALQDYNKAIELNPKNEESYLGRGVHYFQRNDKRALQDYDKAIELDPKHEYSYFLRGVYYYRLKKYQKAIKDFNKAISLNSRYDDAFYYRGRTYHKLKEYQKGIKEFNKTIALYPKHADAYHSKGVAYYKLKDYDQAIELFRQVINLDPKHTHAYMSIIGVFLLKYWVGFLLVFLGLSLLLSRKMRVLKPLQKGKK